MAGNTEAPALAVLKSLGFIVTAIESGTEGEPYFQAENERSIVRFDSFAGLLGLAVLTEKRGENWRPTDREVVDYLELLGASSA